MVIKLPEDGPKKADEVTNQDDKEEKEQLIAPPTIQLEEIPETPKKPPKKKSPPKRQKTGKEVKVKKYFDNLSKKTIKTKKFMRTTEEEEDTKEDL